MIRKIMFMMLAFVFIIGPSTHAQGTRDVELFDIQQEKIIKTAPMSLFFQNEANKYINGIESVYVKVSPIPKTGYMIKIPLDPSIHIKNKWMDDRIDQVIIVYPKDENPFLLVFDKEERVHIFNFKGNANKLLKIFKVDTAKP